MPLRVIAGSARGRRLKLVPGDSTRPIMDKVKEALFSIIGPRVVGATFLDLFSGTGSVGIEALSRGAKQAVFVEIERKAIETIQENLKIAGVGEKAIIRRSDVFDFIKRSPGQFDFIYIAPPQYKGLWQQTLMTLDASTNWIYPETKIIVQIDPKEAYNVDLPLKRIVETQQRRYGKTLLWFFEGRDTIKHIPTVEET